MKSKVNTIFGIAKQNFILEKNHLGFNLNTILVETIHLLEKF